MKTSTARSLAAIAFLLVPLAALRAAATGTAAAPFSPEVDEALRLPKARELGFRTANAQKDKVAELQIQFGQIEKKLVDLRAQHDALLAAHKATRAQEKLTTARASAGRASAAIEGVERMRERMERDAAKASAREEVAAMSAEVAEAEKTQADLDIETRLVELKAKLAAGQK